MSLQLDFTKTNIMHLSDDIISNSDTRFNLFDDVKKHPGIEHYYFLLALGIQLKNKKIIELGTHTGNSAYFLAGGNRLYNNNNTILTYDIELKDRILEDKLNITYLIEDMFDINNREKNRDLLLSSDVIFIDIDPHEGILEYNMYLWLKNNNYKGLVFFDDIHLGRGHMGSNLPHSMEEFWCKVDKEYKTDLTSIGHWSGTGLVCFYPENYNILLDK